MPAPILLLTPKALEIWDALLCSTFFQCFGYKSFQGGMDRIAGKLNWLQKTGTFVVEFYLVLFFLFYYLVLFFSISKAVLCIFHLYFIFVYEKSVPKSYN